MNSFPLETHLHEKVRTLEINYLGEVKYGEQVLIFTERYSKNENSCLVNIVRESDKKEVCRARLDWE